MAITIREELLKRLSRYFSAYRYSLLIAQNQFRKTTDHGFHNVILSTGNEFPALATLHLGIRLDMVERLVYQFTSGLAEYSPHSTTLITSAGRVLGQPYHEYSIEKAADINAVTREMEYFMESEGFIFLEKHGRVQSLNELFNDEPEKKSPYLTNELHRSLRGIILAKLTHRSNWPQLVATYRAQLTQRGTPEQLMQSYDQLANYLRTFSVN